MSLEDTVAGLVVFDTRSYDTPESEPWSMSIWLNVTYNVSTGTRHSERAKPLQDSRPATNLVMVTSCKRTSSASSRVWVFKKKRNDTSRRCSPVEARTCSFAEPSSTGTAIAVDQVKDPSGFRVMI